MSQSKEFETVHTLVHSMDEAERGLFFRHLLDQYPEDIGSVLTDGAAFIEQVEPLLFTLAAEQEEKVGAIKAKLAEKYQVSQAEFSIFSAMFRRALDSIDLDVVTDGLVVAYAGPKGLDLGDPDKAHDSKRSWNSITRESSDADFIIDVDGELFDVRQGMTRRVYAAIMANAKLRNIKPLPDHKELTNTWMTGEAAGDVALNSLITQGNGFAFMQSSLDEDSRKQRFRPAVVIEGFVRDLA